MKELDEYLELQKNPLADPRTLAEKRERLLWFNTATMTQEERRKLSEALD